MSRLRIAVVALCMVAMAGCSSPPPLTCEGGLCSGPGYSPSAEQRFQNGVVAVLSAVGLVPIVPHSAGGPARRTVGR